MGSNEQPHCHNVSISGSINQSSVASHTQIMLEQGSKDQVTVVDTRQDSDKVPLTELHLCRYEDCHGAKTAEPESPLDPIKTRSLYTLLLLVAVWAVLYIILAHENVV